MEEVYPQNGRVDRAYRPHLPAKSHRIVIDCDHQEDASDNIALQPAPDWCLAWSVLSLASMGWLRFDYVRGEPRRIHFNGSVGGLSGRVENETEPTRSQTKNRSS